MRLSRRSVTGLPRQTTTYKGRNVIERNLNLVTRWRGLAARNDELAIVPAPRQSDERSPSGCTFCQTLTETRPAMRWRLQPRREHQITEIALFSALTLTTIEGYAVIRCE